MNNKKPLSSFPVEAESPRGAVLIELYTHKIVRQGRARSFTMQNIYQKQSIEKIY